MLIPDKIRKSVVFLGIEKVDKTTKPVGTALLVGNTRDIDETEKLTFLYLFTAKHVIDRAKGTLVEYLSVRFNLKDGSACWKKCRFSNWKFHPSNPTVDVAILRLYLAGDEDVIIYPSDEILSEMELRGKGLGLGDEVFLTGLFWPHEGRGRSIPLVRTGNIAAMPEEPIPTEDFGSIEAYLIEIRSISGLSGSPVFAYLGPSQSGSVTKLRRSPEGGDWIDSEFYLFGLLHGHFDAAQEERQRFIEDATEKIQLNVGIAIVVPGDKIIEVLQQPDVIAIEDSELNLERRRRATVRSTKTKE
jgi:hypothetical protein